MIESDEPSKTRMEGGWIAVWKKRLVSVLALAAGSVPASAYAAEVSDSPSFGLAWTLPFAGILLSIALFPLLAPHFWERHQGKIAACWASAVILPLAVTQGLVIAVDTVLHTLVLEYIPFILLLLALYTIASGIVVAGNIHGSPAMNTALLALGTGLASLIGTTGASMVMIRPVIRANDNRRRNTHVVVFFIFLVSNVGGSLTPLGDPPLFLGFLRGVDFFWSTTHLFSRTLFVSGLLLGAFYLLDTILYRRDNPPLRDPTPDKKILLRGLVNLGLIGVVIAAILMSASWKPMVNFSIHGVPIELQAALRDLTFVLATFASLALTRREYRQANGFSWGPIKEVAKLFAGIFLCMVPVLAMLRAGVQGPFAPLLALVSNPDGSPNNAAYFWLTGALSSFLDNAPTYLVFFELAGGDPQYLMTAGNQTLAAISSAAVFMGANSYIGNAPNFMVYAIAQGSGVRMPSFFGYMLWSGAVLIPVFVLTTFIFLG